MRPHFVEEEKHTQKFLEIPRARQRLTQAAAASDDCELARTLLLWPPSRSESENMMHGLVLRGNLHMPIL
jgi:hypothetical protein